MLPCCDFGDVYLYVCFLALLFCFACLISGGVRRLLFYFILILFYYFIFSFVSQSPFRFSLCQRIWIACFCMPYLSDPVRRHVIPLSTLLTTLVCSISVSWFCHHRACITLGGRIGTDTGCAACRRVERTV